MVPRPHSKQSCQFEATTQSDLHKKIITFFDLLIISQKKQFKTQLTTTQIMTAHSEDYDMIPPANKPTAKFDAELEKIVKDVLELPLDNNIPMAINVAGVTTWKQFICMDEDDIDGIEYDNVDGSFKLTKFEHKLLSWLIGYVRKNIDADTPGANEVSFYTKEGFAKYSQERREVVRFRSRYGINKLTREGEPGRSLKTLEEKVVDLAAKVKKTTAEILEQLKERKKKESVPEPQDGASSETTNAKQ